MPRTAHVPADKLHKPTGQAGVILRGRHVYLLTPFRESRNVIQADAALRSATILRRTL